MFESTGNKVILKNNNGYKVVPVYTFEKRLFAKDGAYYKELLPKGKVLYTGKQTWYKYFDLGNTQISMFGEELG